MPHVTNLDVQRISLCKLRGANAHAHIRTTPFGPGPSTDYMVLTKVELVHHIFQTKSTTVSTTPNLTVWQTSIQFSSFYSSVGNRVKELQC